MTTLEAALTRTEHTDDGTFGVLRFGRDRCYTLELPWRGNLRQRSCIPTGRYRCVQITSPRFGRVYALAAVRGRSGILIHAANFAGDVTMGRTTHLQGCIAPFERHGFLRNAAGELQRAGLVSRPAVTRLMTWGGGKPFDLVVDGEPS